MRWRHNVIRNNLHLTLTVYLPLPAQQLFNGQKLSLRAFFVMNLKPFVLWGAWQLLLPCWNLMNPNHLKLDIISYGVALSWREIHHKNLWYGFLFTAGDLNLSEIIKRNRMKWRWSSLMWGNNDYKKERKMSEERNSKEFNFDTFFLQVKITQNIKCHLLEDVLKKLQLDFWGWKMSLSKTIFLLGPPRTIHVASKKKVVAFMGL